MDPYWCGSMTSEIASTTQWHLKDSRISVKTGVREIALEYVWWVDLCEWAYTGRLSEGTNIPFTQATVEQPTHRAR